MFSLKPFAGAAALLLSLLAPLLPAGPEARPGAAPAPSPELTVRDGITFAVEGETLYLPLQELRKDLGLDLRAGERREVFLKRYPLRRGETRVLLDGTRLVSLRALKRFGVRVAWDARRNAAVVENGRRRVAVRNGVKRIAVNRRTQTVRLWQGRRFLGESKCSTGRSGFRTPTGRFTAGPFKAAVHFSRQYDNAPMPWTVQVIGNICLHGSGSVPRYPASHGCVRMPLSGLNPARWVFEWIDPGAAVMIQDTWPAGPASA